MKNSGLLCTSVFAAGLLVAAGSAQAILIPAVGPGTGQALIVHGGYGNLGPSGALAPAVFNNDGQMLTAGLGYPVLGGLGGPFRFLSTPLVANVPVGLATFPGQVPGIATASTSMVGVAGFGRAGLAATNYTLNANSAGGIIGANTFGGSVDNVNVGAPLAGVVGHFISGRINLGGAPGDFFAVGVRSRIDIGFGVGLGFVPTATFFPTPIVIGFDGAGALPDFIAGDFAGAQVLGPNSLRAAAASFGTFAIAAGATMRFTGTVTLMGDPASFDFDLMDLNLLNVPLDNFYGMGASSDATSILPTPGAAALLAVSGLFAARRRR